MTYNRTNYQSLLALNERLHAAGRPPVVVTEAPENLEDDDLLEMVTAGLVTSIVVDDYLALFWKQVFPDLTLNTHAVLRRGGALAIAFRRNSPLLGAAAAQYTERWGPGTAYGNIIHRRYLQNTRYVKSATSIGHRAVARLNFPRAEAASSPDRTRTKPDERREQSNRVARANTRASDGE